ncbi:Na+/H+ antiporter subunit E [Paeniglutamicibacter antarcticus]|uniref:Na+/H+ antiporter subunit E n=1 Tax=Paeniglutamicibacter antarcticus TaxID=494023 RepID=A0ABP9TR52_9MICC
MSRDQRLHDVSDEGTKRPRTTLGQELPLLVWMMLIWGALWQDFAIGNLIFGLLLSLGLIRVFRLPPVILSGRFNFWHAAVFVGAFLRDVTWASFEVMYLAVFRGPRTKSAIIAVTLRTDSDLLVTFVGHVLTLVPGSYVVEVDRRSSTLYLHVLNVNDQAGVDAARAAVMKIEERLIRMMGTTKELAGLAALKNGESNEGASAS